MAKSRVIGNIAGQIVEVPSSMSSHTKDYARERNLIEFISTSGAKTVSHERHVSGLPRNAFN